MGGPLHFTTPRQFMPPADFDGHRQFRIVVANITYDHPRRTSEIPLVALSDHKITKIYTVNLDICTICSRSD